MDSYFKRVFEDAKHYSDEEFRQLNFIIGAYEDRIRCLHAENERLTRELAEARLHPSIGEAVRADREKLRALLTRYRTETPLGNQPHMIADDADAAIAAKEE